MIKVILFLIVLLLMSCNTYKEKDYITLKGEFNYSKETTESAKKVFGAEFKKPLYITKNKKIMYYIGGNIYYNYDVFKNVIHENGFSHIGVEF